MMLTLDPYSLGHKSIAAMIEPAIHLTGPSCLKLVQVMLCCSHFSGVVHREDRTFFEVGVLVGKSAKNTKKLVKRSKWVFWPIFTNIRATLCW
jgi:hypothetical protein